MMPGTREYELPGTGSGQTADIAGVPAPTEKVDRRHLIVPLGVSGGALVLLVVGWLINPEFLSAGNFLTILRAGSLIGIAALGTTFVTLSGSYFSLSVQQTATMCAITFALSMAAGHGLIISLVITIVLALALGVFQGGVVALGANPIVTTLGAGAVIYGLAAMMCDLKLVRVVDEGGEWIGTARPFGVPTQCWAFLALTVIAAIVLNRTRFGRLIMLCGSNIAAARASGLSVGLASLAAFAIASLAAAICGIFVAAQFSLAKIDQFELVNFNMNVIAAVVVGGTAIQGGEGSAFRTLVGTIFIALLDNLLILAGQPQGVRFFVVGSFLVLGVSAFHLLRQRSE